MMKHAGYMAVAVGMVLAVGIGVSEQTTGEKKESGEQKATGLAVDDLKFCTSVEDRQPKGEGTSFPGDVGKLYCWTVVTGASSETSVKHVWWYGDKPQAEIPLTVRSARFRTWSAKSIAASQSGTWTVKVTDGEGKVLKEATVTIEGKTEPSPPKSQ